MKTPLFLTAIIGLAVAAQDTPPPDDMKAIQGTWTLVSLEVNGKPIGDSVRATGIIVILKNNTIVFKTKDDGAGTDKDASRAGTFKIDQTKTPKTIDTTFKTDVEPGIYALEGEDTLKLCIAKVKGERPKEFKTKEGDGTRLFVLKREPDKAKEKDKVKDK